MASYNGKDTVKGKKEKAAGRDDTTGADLISSVVSREEKSLGRSSKGRRIIQN